MGIREELKETVVDAVEKAGEVIEEGVQFGEEQAYLVSLKMQMKKEIEQMIHDEKENLSDIEEKLHLLVQDINAFSGEISEAAEGKTADKAITELERIKTKICIGQVLVKRAIDSCKTYSWL
ncbi:hypothetical protein [Staphylococcus simulans]|uniref:hypothetical protein n=1 Tax=Staphylococcus simulans TaxID=1286 RepID=UPI00399B96A0